MSKPNDQDQPNVRIPNPARRTRLHALLFSGAAFGTTILMLAAADPKMPPFRGE